VGVGGPDDGEVDGEHVERELGEALSSRGERREEEFADTNLFVAHLPPEQKNDLVRVLLASEVEHRFERPTVDVHLHYWDSSKAVYRQVNKDVA